MTEDVFYILRYPKRGGYVGVDETSGGYPFRATEPQLIKMWRKKDKAIEYRDKFPKNEFMLAELRLDIRDIKEDT